MSLISNRKQPNEPALYLRRLVESEYVQRQFQDAAMALSDASRRVAKRRGRAVEDKKLYDHLREAATALRNATRGLQHKPAPAPKHNGRKLLALTAASGGAALLWRRRTRKTESHDGTGGEAEHAAADVSLPDPTAAPAPTSIAD